MQHHWRVASILFCLLLTVGVMTACAAPSAAPVAPADEAAGSESAVEESTIVLARQASRGINHLGESNIEGAQNVDLVYESLVQIDGEGNIIPDLATSWEANDDFTVWTFNLRDGVTFHDGTPFNADAVKFNYDRILRVPGQSGGAWQNYADDNTVEVVDDSTVRFTLTSPFPNLLNDMLYIRYRFVSPTFVQEHETAEDPDAMEYLATHASGTGPFKLVEFVPDQRVVFEKNEDYWGGEPGGRSTPEIDTLIFQIIQDPEAARLELESGRVDIVESPPPAQFAAIRETPGLVLNQYKVPRIVYLTMDVSQAPFDDLNVRKAVSHAINYEELIVSGELGTSFELCGLIPDGLNAELPMDPGLCFYPYDVEAAKAALAESEYPDGFDVTLMYAPERNGGFEVEAQLIQSYLAEIGINVTVQPLDVVAQVAQMAEGAYGLSLFVWNAGIPDADDTVGWLLDQSRLPTNESWVGSFWDDTEVQAAMQEARALNDPAARAELYNAANRKAMEEAIYVPLFQGSKVYASQDDIANLDYTIFRRANLWDIERQ